MVEPFFRVMVRPEMEPMLVRVALMTSPSWMSFSVASSLLCACRLPMSEEIQKALCETDVSCAFVMKELLGAEENLTCRT